MHRMKPRRTSRNENLFQAFHRNGGNAFLPSVDWGFKEITAVAVPLHQEDVTGDLDGNQIMLLSF